jgi:hypothetical protein
MKMQGVLLVAVGALCTVSAVLAEPVENVDPGRHPNLAKAQRHIREAWDELTIAQKANDSKMAGHAKRAKELLEQAAAETKEAALSVGR